MQLRSLGARRRDGGGSDGDHTTPHPHPGPGPGRPPRTRPGGREWCSGSMLLSDFLECLPHPNVRENNLLVTSLAHTSMDIIHDTFSRYFHFVNNATMDWRYGINLSVCVCVCCVGVPLHSKSKSILFVTAHEIYFEGTQNDSFQHFSSTHSYFSANNLTHWRRGGAPSSSPPRSPALCASVPLRLSEFRSNMFPFNGTHIYLRKCKLGHTDTQLHKCLELSA